MGAWITGANSALCLLWPLQLYFGVKKYHPKRLVQLIGRGRGNYGLDLDRTPPAAVILVSLVDIFAIFPTFRKAYNKPREENAFAFGINLIKFVLELFALESFNLTAALFPVTILVNDSLLVSMILIRRKRLVR